MKTDIEFPAVVGVAVAIAREVEDNDLVQWRVFIINENDHALSNVIIASKGYGTGLDGEPQNTSVLRHVILELPAQSAAPVELISSEVFHLVNEYWVSYYVDGSIFDKKFLFLPETIVEQNLQPLPIVDMPGILHR